MDIGLMVEGQNGLTWERWRHILRLAERLQIASVFRSDHYMIRTFQDSLEAYLSFVMAAEETTSLRFGPLVTPMTFRSPVDVGRMAGQISLLSEGRFVMGLGAGWHEPEHIAYGIPFHTLKERMDRLEETLELVQALWRPGPTTYAGRYYQVQEAECLPKPNPAPPILIGGTGEKRTLRMVAQHAVEWNSVNLGPEAFAQKLSVLERHCADLGRDPATIKKSMMLFAIVAPTPELLDRVTSIVMGLRGVDGDPAAFRAASKEQGMLVGGTDEMVDWLGSMAALGLSEVQVQHFLYDEDDIPTWLAQDVQPQVAAL
ncbi:MAG: Flavin-dependent oxidoreductase, luciferase family [Chloroflexi bacterium]|jgi:F420-dependent oxidoreductase-like protein|nr:MAG: Flavin-dependent oxidoreductase, luciferase family [Chloroflexota bacterium]